MTEEVKSHSSSAQISIEHDGVSKNAWNDAETQQDGSMAQDEQEASQSKAGNPVKTNLVGYCESTSLHGFAYLPAARNWCERIFWAIVILTALIIGSVIIYETFDYWANNPSISTVATYSYPVTKFQFPTVTICAHQDYDRMSAMRLLLNSVQYACKFEDPAPSDVEYEDWVDFIPIGGLVDEDGIDLGAFGDAETDYDYHEIPPYDPMMPTNFELEYEPATDCSALDEIMEKGGPIAHIIEKKVSPAFGTRVQNYLPKMQFKHLLKAFAFMFKQHGHSTVLSDILLKAEERFSGKPWRFKHLFFNYTLVDPDFDKQFEDSFKVPLGMKFQDPTPFYFYEQFLAIGKAHENLGSHLQGVMHGEFGRTLSPKEGSVYAPHLTLETQRPEKQELYKFTLKLGDEEKSFLEYMEQILQGLFGAELSLDIGLLDLPGIMNDYDNSDHKLEWKSAFIYSYMKAANSTDETSCKSKFSPSIDYMKCLAEENYFGKKLTPYRNLVMKVLRISEVIGNAMLSSDQHNNIIGDMKYLNYDHLRHELPVIVSTDDPDLTPAGIEVPKEQFQKDSSRLEMVMYCEHSVPGGRQLCNKQFHHVPTTNGICSAYNSAPLEDVFKKNEFFNNVAKFYTIKTPGMKVANTVGAGARFALSVVLDLHKREIMSSTGNSFTIAINNKDNFFDLGQQGLLLWPGSYVQILVDAVRHEPSPDFNDLSYPDDRSCKQPQQVDKGSMFEKYTQKGCYFECLLKHSTEVCGCTPWNFPTADDSTELCDGYNARCFAAEMYNSTVMSERCSCPEECSQIVFSPQINSYEMNYRTFCDSNLRYETVWPLLAPEDVALHRRQNDTFGTWIDYKRSPWYHNYICLEKAQKDLVSVDIQMKSAFVQHIEQSIRVSFMDKIGILGGTFGLFTGLSIISFVEIAFWLHRLMADAVCFKKK